MPLDRLKISTFCGEIEVSLMTISFSEPRPIVKTERSNTKLSPALSPSRIINTPLKSTARGDDETRLICAVTCDSTEFVESVSPGVEGGKGDTPFPCST